MNMGVSVYHNAAQGIAAGAWAVVSFNSEYFDTDGFHDTAVNNSRITVPVDGAGTYLLTANTRWGNADYESRAARFSVNGGSYYVGFLLERYAPPDVMGWSVSTIADFDEGDYIELEVYVKQAGGNIERHADYSPVFAMQRLC